MGTTVSQDKNLGQFNNFKIIKTLGQGGMGDVYLAEDLLLERKVAIKFLRVNDNEKRGVLVKRFQNEAKILASISHPNVVQVYSFGDKDDVSFMVMELVDGKNLYELLKKKKYTLDESVELLRQLLSGVHATHERGVLHRDIKPANIIVDNYGKVTLVDFGISKSLIAVDPKLTQDKHFVGTASYMAPEILSGMSPTPRSDIFSVGIVFYELLCGEGPFHNDNYLQVLEKIKNLDITLPPGISQQLSPQMVSVFNKMVARDPLHRFESAGEILGEINSIYDLSFAQTQILKTSYTGGKIDIPSPQVARQHWNLSEKFAWPFKIVVAMFVLATLSFMLWKYLPWGQIAMKLANYSPIEVDGSTGSHESPEDSLSLENIKKGISKVAGTNNEPQLPLTVLPVGTSWVYEVRDINQTTGKTLKKYNEKFQVVSAKSGVMTVTVRRDSKEWGRLELSSNRFIPPLTVSRGGREPSSLKIKGDYQDIYPLARGKIMNYVALHLKAGGYYDEVSHSCQVKDLKKIQVMGKATESYYVVCEGTSPSGQLTQSYYYSLEHKTLVREEKSFTSKNNRLYQVKKLIDFQLPGTKNSQANL
jgi:serine/threonine protein kinase